MDERKSYLVTYKDGQKETVTGKILFFTNNGSGLLSKNCNVHLNSDSVRSIVEIDSEGGKE